jgi:hypothetical protein
MRTLITVLCWFIGGVPFALLCFILMLRGSISLYYSHGFNVWITLAILSFVALILLLIYMLVAFRKIWGHWPMSFALVKGKTIFALFILIGCYAYVWAQFSDGQAKSQSVYGEASKLHPFLTLAVSTILIVDRGLVVTDIARVPDDYEAMGLQTNRRSLHFAQADGYVYAVDIRTNGRSGIRNTLVKGFFYAMGFNTIRHTGNADHLHISLSPRNRRDVK